MFGVPKERIDKKSPLRQKSKIAVLACGYGGSAGALKAFGALEMGLREEELKPLVDAWRAANPHIVRLWWEADRAALTVVRERDGHRDPRAAVLLSERTAAHHPAVRAQAFLCEAARRRQPVRRGLRDYEGVGRTKKWERLESYGRSSWKTSCRLPRGIFSRRRCCGWTKRDTGS
jgi:DNA polymerase